MKEETRNALFPTMLRANRTNKNFPNPPAGLRDAPRSPPTPPSVNCCCQSARVTVASAAPRQASTVPSFAFGVPPTATSASNGLPSQPPVNYTSRPMASLVPQHFPPTGSPAGTPPPGSIRLPGTPQAQIFSHQQTASRTASPAQFPTSNAPPAFGASGIPAMSTFGATRTQQPLQPLQPQTSTQPSTITNAQSQGKDPFADLAGLF